MLAFSNIFNSLNMLWCVAGSYSLMLHCDVTSKALSSVNNRLLFRVNMLGGHCILMETTHTPRCTKVHTQQSSTSWLHQHVVAKIADMHLRQRAQWQPGCGCCDGLPMWCKSVNDVQGARNTDWFVTKKKGKEWAGQDQDTRSKYTGKGYSLKAFKGPGKDFKFADATTHFAAMMRGCLK